MIAFGHTLHDRSIWCISSQHHNHQSSFGDWVRRVTWQETTPCTFQLVKLQLCFKLYCSFQAVDWQSSCLSLEAQIMWAKYHELLGLTPDSHTLKGLCLPLWWVEEIFKLGLQPIQQTSCISMHKFIFCKSFHFPVNRRMRLVFLIVS